MLEKTQSSKETKELARRWIAAHPEIKIWFLKGNLGAGKTAFVKGAAKVFNEDENKVKSPTFALIEEHGSWVHADLYRLEEEDPLLTQALEEYLEAGHILFIEWPERLKSWENRPRAEIQFTHLGDDQRQLELTLLP